MQLAGPVFKRRYHDAEGFAWQEWIRKGPFNQPFEDHKIVFVYQDETIFVNDPNLRRSAVGLAFIDEQALCRISKRVSRDV